MLILRGPPGSGKSYLADHIKKRYPTAHICNEDVHTYSFSNRLYKCDHDVVLRACEAEVRDCAVQSISPIVIDGNNVRSYECRIYTEIARSFDYNVIIVTPKTPWRFDVRSLAGKSTHRVSPEIIGSMVSHFEPTIYPLYYGWFFAGAPSCNVYPDRNGTHPSKETEKIIQRFYAIYLSILELSYVRQRLASMCNLDPNIDINHLAKFWSSAVNPTFGEPSESIIKVSRPHCTTFFSNFGRATGAIEYSNRSAVREGLLGFVQSICLEGLFVTKRTVGLRVKLSGDEQMNLWGGLDDEPVDGYAPNEPRPKGCRAHVTLALAPGISAVETGFDALRIADSELLSRPDVTRMDLMDGVLREIPVSTTSEESAFYYQFNTPQSKMHKAFTAIRLIRGNHYDFECITCFKNYLLIGTKSGQILIYEFTPLEANSDDFFIPSASDQKQSRKTVKFTVIDKISEEEPALPTFRVKLCVSHNLCKKRIQQLQAVPEYGFFLVLTEFQLSAHSLSNRQLVSVLPNSKGATVFAIQYQSADLEPQNDLSNINRRPAYTAEVRFSSTKPSRLNLCFCVKKKLFFFRWSPSRGTFVTPSESEDPSISFWPSEYSLIDTAVSLQFCGTETLLIALRSHYLTMNLRTLECRKISASMKMATAIMAPLPYCLDLVIYEAANTEKEGLDDTPDEKWILGTSAPFAVASDENLYTLMPLNDDVGSTPTSTLSDIPQCLHAFSPYLLAALPKRLEIHSLEPNDLVQVINIPRIRSMCSNGLGWLYASAASSVYEPDDSQPCLSSDECHSSTMGHGSDVWLLLSANRLRCVQKLVNAKEFKMALRLASFANISGQPSISNHQICALYAFHLFNTQRLFDTAFQHFYKLKIDPILVLGLCGGDIYKEESPSNYPFPPEPLTESEKAALFEPLITYLVRWRSHLRSGCPHGVEPEEFLEQQISCGGIVDASPKLRKRRSILEAVDTSLLKCYNVTNVARIGPLLRQENYCSLEAAEQILKASKQTKDLVRMYKMREMHQMALSLMTSESGSGKESFSYQEIVNFLKDLPNAPFDLVSEFCESILKQHPREWMSIFLAWERKIYCSASIEKKEEYYSLVSYRDKVIRYLERVAPHLLIPFLECALFGTCGCEIDEEEEGLDALDIVHEDISEFPDERSSTSLSNSPSNTYIVQNDLSTHVIPRKSTVISDTPLTGSQHFEATCVWPFPKHCHTHPPSQNCRVCRSLDHNEDVRDLYEMPEICPPPAGFSPCVALYDSYARTLIKEIQTNSHGKVMPYHVQEEEPHEGVVARLRYRLLTFLCMKNVQLSTEELMFHFPYDGCFEERAVLLARLGRHRQALTMWVHLLGDWNKALEHCAQVQAEAESRFITASSAGGIRKDNETPKLNEIYTTLIDVCLNPLEPIALGIILPGNESPQIEINTRFKPRIDLALEVATQFSEFVDVTKVLQMIPDDVNLKSISPFLKSAFKRQAGMRTRLIFFNNAVQRESLRSHNDRVTTTAAQMFKVTNATRCQQCRRRIGTSAFFRYPDSGDLVHYGCCPDLSTLISNSSISSQPRL
nr:Vam6:Vps39 protein [Hymenolepis microstoma]